MGPPRKICKICVIFGFFRPTQKMGREGPKWAGKVFFRLKKTSPTFWAERILILRIFVFLIFLGPKFLAWAHLGPPTWARHGWAHPLGPGMGGPTHLGPAWVGPPTWAHRLGPGVGGPTHLGPAWVGPAWAHPLGPLGRGGGGRPCCSDHATSTRHSSPHHRYGRNKNI